MEYKERENMKKGDIIQRRDGHELPLMYSGENNGHIWYFYGISFKNDEDMDGYFDEKNIKALTAFELKAERWEII